LVYTIKNPYIVILKTINPPALEGMRIVWNAATTKPVYEVWKYRLVD
jgi:hypothetical protein